MKPNKILILLIMLSILGTFFVFNDLPDRIPTHWNLKGEVDSYSGKSFAFFTAFLPLILYILSLYLPKIDPKRQSYLKHKKAYEIVIMFILLFLIMIHWATILFSLGYNLDISTVVRWGVGLLFIVIGNYMGQIRHNYFFGIKLPWTLANETVWRKTHRVGGFGFIVVGLIFILTSSIISFISLIVLVIGLGVYSYIEFKKLESKS
ncbi:MAG: hypothetical protein PWQ82_870 [Thermosediminibacterales bacterium]|nr:hypothetical protein [Thermosediminibacterales bacterium]